MKKLRPRVRYFGGLLMLASFLVFFGGFCHYLSNRRQRRNLEIRMDALASRFSVFDQLFTGLSSTVSNLVLTVDATRGAGAGAGADASFTDAPSPPPPRVLGWGQNRKWVYCDVVWTDNDFVEHTERRYIARIPASLPAP